MIRACRTQTLSPISTREVKKGKRPALIHLSAIVALWGEGDPLSCIRNMSQALESNSPQHTLEHEPGRDFLRATMSHKSRGTPHISVCGVYSPGL